jgi:hypothetical protein
MTLYPLAFLTSVAAYGIAAVIVFMALIQKRMDMKCTDPSLPSAAVC